MLPPGQGQRAGRPGGPRCSRHVSPPPVLLRTETGGRGGPSSCRTRCRHPAARPSRQEGRRPQQRPGTRGRSDPRVGRDGGRGRVPLCARTSDSRGAVGRAGLVSPGGRWNSRPGGWDGWSPGTPGVTGTAQVADTGLGSGAGGGRGPQRLGGSSESCSCFLGKWAGFRGK